MLQSCFFSIIAIYAILGFARTPSEYSRFIIVGTIIFWFFLSAISRPILKSFLHKFKIFTNPVLLIGDYKFYKLVEKSLHQNIYLSYKISSWLSTDKNAEKVEKDIKIGRFSHDFDFNSLAKKYPYLVVQQNFAESEKVFVRKMILVFKEIFIVPENPLANYLNSDTIFLFSAKVFLTRIRNNLKSPLNKLIKELFDRILSFILLMFFLPFLAVLCLAVVIDDPSGPPFIEKGNPAQLRIGKNGKIFRVYKFRTMFVNPDRLLIPFFKKHPEERENWEKYKKIKGDDPRITRFGKFLRKFSIDEMPQLINVFLGNMSLVGPRPYLPREKDDMKKYFDTIVTVKPGITGLWQVSGRSELSFQQRMRLDVWYIYSWSVWLDIVILLKTIGVILSRKGAY